MSIKKELLNAGNVPVYFDWRTGSLANLGSVGTNPTYTGTSWGAAAGERAISLYNANCLITMPDNAAYNLSELSIVCLTKYNPRAGGDNRRILMKKGSTDANTHFDFYLVPATSVMRLASGAGPGITSPVLPGFKNASSFGMTWISGIAPKAFINNAYAGDFLTTLSYGGSGSSNLAIGNYGWAQSNSWNFQSPMRALMLINRSLSNAEMVRLMQELEDESGAMSRPFYSIPNAYPIKRAEEYVADGIKVDLPLTSSTNNVFVDLSGNNNNGVGEQLDTVTNGLFGQGVRFRGRSIVTVTDTGTNIPETVPVSYEFWYKPDTITGQGILVEKGVSGSGLSCWRSNNILYLDLAGTSGITNFNNAFSIGKWTHVVAQYDGTSANTLFVDGVAVGTNTGTPVLATSTDVLAIGNRNSGRAYPANGTITSVRVRNRMLTPAEARANYLKGASRIVFDGRLPKDGSCPVMPTAIAGGKIPGTPWNVNSGSYKITEQTPTNGALGKRTLTNSTNGMIYSQDTSAYGSWYFEFNKVGANTSISLPFISDRVGLAGDNAIGYSFNITTAEVIDIRAMTGAGSSTIMGSAVAYIQPNTDYQIWITRRSDGQFTMWLKGGIWSTWTMLSPTSGTNPATHATYTTNKYVVADLDAGDYIGDFIHFQGEMTPSEAVNYPL